MFFLDKIYSTYYELLKGAIDHIIKSVIEGKKEDLIIEDNEFIYQITSTENQNNNENSEMSTIKLGECENILKEHYNISKDEPLLIFKIDFYEEGLLIPRVEYEVYNFKTKEQLDLNLCIGTKVNLFLPAKINENEKFKYNQSSEYYNDVCYTYTTDNGTDITLTDRKSEFVNNNMSLCKVDCDYKGYNSDNKKANCECQIKIKLPLISEIIINQEELLNNFVDINNSTNFKIMKCGNILFTKEGLKNNIGSYSTLSVISILLINSILFIFKGFNLLCEVMNKILEKKECIPNLITPNNYIKNENNKEIKVKKIKNNNNNIKNNNNEYEKEENTIDINSNKNNPTKKINILKMNENKITGQISELDIINRKNIINNYKKGIFLNKGITNLYKDNNNINKYNDYEINSLSYREALKKDKRKYFEYYFSLLRKKHTLIFTFYTSNDYNSIDF